MTKSNKSKTPQTNRKNKSVIEISDYDYGATYKKTSTKPFPENHKNQMPSVVGVKTTEEIAAEIMEDEHGKWFEQTLTNLQTSKRDQDFWNEQKIRRDQFAKPNILQKIKSFLGISN